MSRGKNAASQNARKLAVAEERITELENELGAVRQSAHIREQELATELQAIRNRLAAEADILAAEKVEEARRDAQARVDQLEKQHRDSVVDAFRYLDSNGVVELPLAGWGEIAAILNVHVGHLVTSVAGSHNRNARRANRAHVNQLAEVDEKLRRSPARRGL